MCGEKFGKEAFAWPVIGSPPRVRGEALRAPALPVNLRITPACAGRSGLQRNKTVKSGDHPRVCGEKGHSQKCEKSGGGSPPRVRGEAVDAARAGFAPGITPACAGRRLCNADALRLVEDHPRVCGEKC